MPIFEYRCSACDHLEEVLQKHTDPAPATCPVCGKQGTLAKEISATSFQLKGGGWYKDLYASAKKDSTSSAKGESSSSSSSSSSESKSEAKKDSSSGSSSSGSSSSGGSSGGSSSGGSSASSSAAA